VQRTKKGAAKDEDGVGGEKAGVKEEKATRKSTRSTAGKKAANKDEVDPTGEEIEELDDTPAPKEKGKKRATKGDDESDEEAEEKPSKKGKGKAKESEPVSAADFAHPKREQDHLKIVSWNVAGFKSILGKGFLEYLTAEDPDIICLQETKIKEELALSSNLPGHYHAYFNTCTENAGYSGTGLLSKIKPIAVTKGIGKDEHDKEGRVLTAEYDKFYLVSSYVPNSGRGLVNLDYRVNVWDVDFLAYLKALEQKKPVVWCGDLNVAHLEIDLKNPKTNKKTAGFTPQERESFSKILASGFVDTFRHLYPTVEGAYTFWSYMGGARGKDVGWRLDYFIVSQNFMPAIVDHVIRKTVQGSDHCPILLLIKNA